ncbi:MAG TPA: hypothetical protein VIV12_02755 [Streptosporangiaceae bacterium]
MFDGEVSRAWCGFVEGLVGSQSVVGVAEQVDFDGEGVAVADGGAVDMMLLIIVNTLVRIMQSKFG